MHYATKNVRRNFVKTWNYTCHNLKLNYLPKVDVPGPLLGKGPLSFDSYKCPPSLSNLSVFAFWVVAYWGVDCVENVFNGVAETHLYLVTYM